MTDRVSLFCRDNLFPRFKFLSDDWQKYDAENENSLSYFVCAKMKMNRITRCVCSGNPVPGGSCNHSIPIATSPPRESPPHLCHPVVLPLRSPWGAFRRGFQRVPRSLDSVTRSDVTTWVMSHQVFIAGTACISGEGQQPPL